MGVGSLNLSMSFYTSKSPQLTDRVQDQVRDGVGGLFRGYFVFRNSLSTMWHQLRSRFTPINSKNIHLEGLNCSNEKYILTFSR